MPQIEFPSILLPEGIKSGSVVDINVSRNHPSEAAKEKDFRNLQQDIWETFGKHTPKAPVLRCRNTTQTAVVLEWDALELATAKLRSLSIYRNGEKMGNIPDPLHNTSTKISGLAIDRDYTFQLELRTSSGQFKSELLKVHTHKMTELSGIRVAAGVMAEQLKDSLEKAVERIGGEVTDSVRLETTHFVCMEGRGREWEKAKDMNIPVVRPEWVEGCEREGRMVGVKDYYLDANPKLRQIGPGPNTAVRPDSQHSQAAAAQTSRESVSNTAVPLPSRPAETPRSTGPSASATSLSAEVVNEDDEIEDSPRQKRDESDDEEDDEEHDNDDGDMGRGYSPAPSDQGSGRQRNEHERDPGTPSNFEDVAL